MTEQSPVYSAGGPTAEMPRFISCKPVWALKIRAIEPAHMDGEHGGMLQFEDPAYAPKFMSTDWINRRGAQAGGWLVVYRDDYSSWSPDTAFQNGAVPEHLWGLTPLQEPKYTVDQRGAIVKRSDRRPLPADEPLFILRAQDVHAMEALRAYRDALPDGSKVRDSMDERLIAFSAFRTQQRHRMKQPDSDGAGQAATGADPQRWAPGERERMAGDDTAT